ncbi:MAG: glycosyltransferase family 4 protein [Gammaproteobacteria bacterium]|nr:glycosyltransferase family 4 protein [Gammaproteobacteria bacterium]MDH3412102.1 glycosyltransferase family 4 protein [Gammaproteobacteria bacterium]
MKILTFSTLYPNAARPGHGIFVQTQLRQLLAQGTVESRVVAPVPWFPWSNPLFGQYAVFSRSPREERRYGIDVIHPRYVSVPKLGMSLAPFLLAAGAYSAVKRIIRLGYDFEIIDAHYFYPDGVAAAMMGRWLNIPVVITARGTDINLLPQFAFPRRMILWAARRAAALVTVSTALKTALVQLGVDANKISVLRSGVDTRLFHPVDRASQRARLGLTGTVLLMVGNLVALKGHDVVLRALREFSGACLFIIGEGREERSLKQLACVLGIQDRVRFLGAMPQEQLADYYGAADALVLASSREGWPNVLLEAMACGTPVVSTRVGGTPEIVAAPEAGVLSEERSAHGILEALQRLFRNYPDRELTRRYAEGFGWAETTAGQLEIFGRILSAGATDKHR